MNSDNATQIQPQFQFTYTVTGKLAEFVFLQLFDADDKLVAKGHQQLTIRLSRGLYQLHIFSNGKLEQQTIRLDKDYSSTWQNSGTYSSIPGSFLQSSHEYYTDNANYWSRNTTIQTTNQPVQESALFLFFRYPDEDIKEQQQRVAQSMGWRFLLLNSARELIYRLQDDAIREDPQKGWLAFHAKLAPGIYYLVYNGPRPREIPLYVFPGWQTQFFLTFKRTPIFQTARIQLIRPHTSFDRTEKDNLELDILLQNMQNGIYHLPSSLIKKTAHAKWENPMLAIVVCYTYLLGAKSNDDNLFRIMIGNLQQHILNSDTAPDIKAIRLLAALHFKEDIPPLTLDEPCMLTAGMKAFIEQSVLHPNKITISDQSEEIIMCLQSDTIWTSYLPLEYDKTDYPTEHILFNNASNDYIADMMQYELYQEKTEITNINPTTDWLSQSIINQLSSEKEKKCTVSDLASQFLVTPALVESRVRQIDRFLNSGQNWLANETESSTNLNLNNLTTQIKNIINEE